MTEIKCHGFSKHIQNASAPLCFTQQRPEKPHIQAIQMSRNRLKAVRESLLMSKAELARKANVSPMTIARIEKGKPCRLETKRKIILALGLNLADKDEIFQDD